jgi:hypothetical protein
MSKDDFERRARLVVLAYSVLGGMKAPPANLSDKEVLMAIAREARKKATEAMGRRARRQRADKHPHDHSPGFRSEA